MYLGLLYVVVLWLTLSKGIEGKCTGQICPPTTDAKCLDKPKVSGLCMAFFPSYSYITGSRRCESFVYGGCGGSTNRFSTYNDCVGTCVAPCNQPITVGPCRAGFKRYAFNKRIGQCEQFFYGGCRGNKNNFKTMSQCKGKCMDACGEPPKNAGPCFGNFIRFSFVPLLGQCVSFTYGGCSGNRNNFRSKWNCHATCL